MIVREDIEGLGVMTMSELVFDEALRKAFKEGYESGYMDNNMLEASNVSRQYDEWWADKYKWKIVDEDGVKIGDKLVSDL